MSDYDYLKIDTVDKQVLKNITAMGDQLKELKLDMLKKEAEYKQAKDAYEHFANVLLPAEMFSVGVDSISLASGGRISVKHNYYCQPNKNAADRAIIADWLRQHDGDYLIKSEAIISGDDVDMLDDLSIPYVSKEDINTNSLKSFIKDKLGVTTGVKQIDFEDIPKCIHFQDVVTVELEV